MKKIQLGWSWWVKILFSWHKKRDNVSNLTTNGRRQRDSSAGIGYFGKTSVKFIVERINRVRYINLIKEQINNHAERISGPDYIFQQDNAPVHTSRLVQSHFNENNISILAWPARSLELNIIENFWVELVHGVFPRTESSINTYKN